MKIDRFRAAIFYIIVILAILSLVYFFASDNQKQRAEIAEGTAKDKTAQTAHSQPTKQPRPELKSGVWKIDEDLEVSEVLLVQNIPVQGKKSRSVRIVKSKFKYPFLRIESLKATHKEATQETIFGQTVAVADHIMVSPVNGVSVSELNTSLEGLGYQIRRKTPSYLLVEIPDFQRVSALAEVIRQLSDIDDVHIAEPDYLVRHMDLFPDEMSNNEQSLWAMYNSGGVYRTIDSDIDAPAAWSIRNNASGVIVGITDTGLHITHEDLKDNLWTNPDEIPNDGIDNDNNGYVDDIYGVDVVTEIGNPLEENGHGTHVAGTVGAQGNNGKGVVGVAWDVQLLGARFLGPVGYGTNSDAISAVNYCVGEGARIINASWGGGGRSEILKSSLLAANDSGVIFVAAAGNYASNNDQTPIYPAAYRVPNVLSVAATDDNDNITSFSNYGNSLVHLGAPGKSIKSAYFDNYWFAGNDGYARLSGTSMAAPHVAGTLALLNAEFPAEDVSQLISRILTSVDPLDSLSDKVLSGGRLNASKALSASRTNPLNDDFENAIEWLGSQGAWTGSLKHATTEAGEIVDQGQGNVWFKWSPLFDGTAQLHAESTDENIGVRIYSYINSSLQEISAALPNTVVDLNFFATTGQQYYVSVYYTDTAPDHVDVDFSQPSTNDNFRDAVEITTSSFDLYGSNLGATAEKGEPTHAGEGWGKSVWFKWIASESTDMVISTFGSSFDTVLAVYTGDNLADLSEVISNDDTSRSDLTSRVRFDAIAGTTYYIAIDSYWDTEGQVRLTGYPYSTVAILDQPQSIEAVEGRPATFSVNAQGPGILSYQWFFNGNPVPGIHGRSYTIPAVSNEYIGEYYVVVSSRDESVTSSTAELSYQQLEPEIFWQMRDIDVVNGNEQYLQVLAGGTGPFTYQWYHNDVAIAGAVNPSYRIPSMSESNQGIYHVEITGLLGTIESDRFEVRFIDTPWDQWRWRNPLPLTYTMNDVRYIEGEFIAVGDGGTLARSPDGKYWKTESFQMMQYMDQVAYGAGTYVIGGRLGEVLRSTDGHTWTKHNTGQSSTISELEYHAGQFIARTSYGYVLTSTDGTSWSIPNQINFNGFSEIILHGGQVFALKSNTLYSSSDGVNWSSHSPGFSIDRLYSFDGKLFAWDDDYYPNANLYTSTDGISWSGPTALDDDWIGHSEDMIEVDGMLYGTAYNQRVFFSEDGETRYRYQLTPYQSADLNAIAYGNGTFVIVGSDGLILSEEDFDKFSLESGRFTESLTMVNEVDGELVAMDGKVIMTSGDGITWRKGAIDFGEESYVTANGMVYDGTRYWLALGHDGLAMGYDYQNFRQWPIAPTGSCYDLCYGNGLLAARFDGYVHYSSDGGNTWQASTLPRTAQFDYAAGHFVAHISNTIYTSTDLVNWNTWTDPSFKTFDLVAERGNQILGISWDGWVFNSTDGSSWSRVDSDISHAHSLDSDGSNIFIATTNSVFFGNDFNDWYESHTPGHSYALTEFKETLVSVGGGGNIMQAGMVKSSAPEVNIKGLGNNTTVPVGFSLLIEADVWDPEGNLVDVEFIINGASQGIQTSEPFQLLWSPSMTGEYTIRVKARDADGMVRSDSVLVTAETGTTTIPLLTANTGFETGSMAYHDGIYYVVGIDGKLYTSGDAINWSSQTLFTQERARQIAIGNGKIVVMGESGSAAVSSDGINWIVASVTTTSGNSLQFADGYFFFLSSNKIYLSEDGLNWTSSYPTDFSYNNKALAYGNDVFLVAGNNPTLLYASENGLDWSRPLRSESYNFHDVVYGDNGFVAVLHGAQIIHSHDGFNWSQPTTLSGDIRDVTHVNGYYFLGGYPAHSTAGYKMLYVSRDGLQWTPTSGSGTYDGIAYGNGTLVAVANDNLFRSTDGINWEEVPGIPGGWNWQIQYGDSGFFASDENGSSIFSADGSTFTFHEVSDFEEPQDYYNITFFNGMYVACGNNEGIFTSPDGREWTKRDDGSSSSNYDYNQFFSGPGILFAYGTGPVAWTEDGINWQIANGLSRPVDIAYDNGQFIALSNSSSGPYFSEDGKTWSLDPSPPSELIFASQIEFGGGVGVVVKYSTIYNSFDGSNWNPASYSLPGPYSAELCYGHGKFVIVKRDDNIHYSSDGDNWQSISLGSDILLTFVCTTPTGFLALDSNGRIYRSPDAVNWTQEDAFYSNADKAFQDDSGKLFLTGDGQVVVYSQLDLMVESLTSTTGTMGIGDEFEVTVQIKNFGDADFSGSEPVDIGVWFSRDRFWGNADDFKVHDYSASNLAISASQSVTETFSFLLPESLQAGDFHVGVHVDSSNTYSEIREPNNYFISSSSEVHVPEWYLNVSASGDGDVQRSNYQQRYVHGSSVLLIPVASKGSVFSGWSGAGLSGLNDATVMMTDDLSIFAQFEQAWPLRIQVNGNGSVATTPDSTVFVNGTVVQLVATTAPGWNFSGWSGDISSSSTNTSITMDSSKTVAANFSQSYSGYQEAWFTPAERATAIAQAAEDADGDNFLNWQEHAAGSSPRDSSDLPIKEILKTKNELILIYTRNTGSPNSVICKKSNDLSSWSSTDIEERVLSSTNGIERVEARIRFTDSDKAFMRLEFQQNN